MPTVARFNVTLVKSTALQHPEQIELDERGAPAVCASRSSTGRWSSGRRDFQALDVFATYRLREGKLMFGVYADVERAGTVRVGDPVIALDD
jgi:hypothetical protein